MAAGMKLSWAKMAEVRLTARGKKRTGKKMCEPSDLIRRCGEKKREGGAWARDDRRISIRRLRAEEGIGRVERAVRRGERWAGENAAH